MVLAILILCTIVVIIVTSIVRYYTVYVQIFAEHNFRGLLFPNISRKQFSRIKGFEYTIVKFRELNFRGLLKSAKTKSCAAKIWMYTVHCTNIYAYTNEVAMWMITMVTVLNGHRLLGNLTSFLMWTGKEFELRSLRTIKFRLTNVCSEKLYEVVLLLWVTSLANATHHHQQPKPVYKGRSLSGQI